MTGSGADDYIASAATSGVVSVGGFSTGNIESYEDVDWFKVTLTAGTTYRFDLEGVDTSRGTLANPWLELFNTSGTAVIIRDDDTGTGLNSLISYTASASGTYYLAASSYSITGTGTYRLSATVGGGGGGGDDYIVSAATSGVVSVGGFSTGNIETAGDVDWFKVTLTAGTTYRIDLEGADSSRGTLADPQLELFNTTGTLVIASDDDTGTGLNSQITYTPTATGTYYLGALSHTSTGTGTYRVSVAAAGPTDDYGSTTSTAGAINTGQTLNGSIETGGDVDWFSIALTGGQSYQFDLRGVDSGRGTLTDPKLYLLNSSGAAITFSDDDGVGLDAMIQYSPAVQSSGIYYLAVQGYSNTMTGTYQLTTSLMGGTTINPVLQTSSQNILRGSATGAEATFLSGLSNQVAAGTLTTAQANAQIVAHAINTTSVATLAYEFFTGRIPSLGGIDYLVSPTGPNPNNLNSAYYQSFNVENRYINFAVNLGKLGEGAATFNATYGGLNLFDATRSAYRTIFGATPTDAKIHALLDPTFVLGGVSMTRADYFAYYGQDGQNGIGSKAAMVGWLMAEAQKADVGMYARSNDAFLLDLADGATFGVDIVGVYGSPAFIFNG